MTENCFKAIQLTGNRNELRQTMKWLVKPSDEYMGGHDQLYFYEA